MKNLLKKIRKYSQNSNFLHLIENVEQVISKLLSIFMILVILIAIVDLGIHIINKLSAWNLNKSSFNDNLFKTFGLFLNILIALEILENITAYLRKNLITIELVIATSLIAVARKIILLDLNKTDGMQVFGLGVAVFALSISYWIIRRSHYKNNL